MELPDTFWQALRLVGGFAAFCVGMSFAYKFIKASFEGKVSYWSGLKPFGLLFAPITVFLTPLLIHLPYDPQKSLVKEEQKLWVHLFWGPVFFVLALMFMCSGADLMGLPGAQSLNFILTAGRSDVPQCILYDPPFHYRFPIAKKASKTILRFLTTRLPESEELQRELQRENRERDDDADFDRAFGFDKDNQPQPAVAPVSNVTRGGGSASSHGGGKRHR